MPRALTDGLSAVSPGLLLWKRNAAVTHSKENPGHILGPYEGYGGEQEIDCNLCGFDTAEMQPEPEVSP